MVQRLTYLFAGVFFFALASCGPKKQKKAKEEVVVISEIYDEDKFANIIFDLTLVESAYRLNMANEESVLKKNEVYKEVLLAHETDSTVFEENWKYYGYRPEQMQEVYGMVLEKIEQNRVERGAAPSKKKEDE